MNLKKEKTLSDQVWSFFCSVRLAIYTLVLLSVTSIIGTVILQNRTEQQYVREYGQGLYNLIKVFGFDDMYHAWWFLTLIIILCLNIIVCSIERLSTTWKIIFPKKISFNKNRFRKLKNLASFSIDKDTGTLVKEYEATLSKTVGPVIKETADGALILYAERGRWTRSGIYVVHTSIILLLIGALIGSVFGFRATMNLEEGQTSGTVFNRKTGETIDIGFKVRCNDFSVSFYDTGAPQEFLSNLTIIENGTESFSQDLRVNHPLRYRGINIFQASYGNTSPESVVFDVIRSSDKERVMTQSLKIGEQFDLPDGFGQFLLEGFIPHFDFRGQNLGGAFVGRIIPADGEPFQIGLPLRFSQFDRMRKGEFSFVIKETVERYYTGLQVTKDPGVWYVYVGFILLIVGCWITFFMSHQSYMVEIQSSEDGESMVSVSGTSNRNAHGMKLKIKKLHQLLKG